jgi:hypothetical protein
LLDEISNPGAATPQGLYELYKSRATTTGNPYLLRQANCRSTLTTSSIGHQRYYTPPPLPQVGAFAARAQSAPPRRPDPPRLDFAAPTAGSVRSANGSSLRVLNAGAAHTTPQTPPLGLTLHSLTFRR